MADISSSHSHAKSVAKGVKISYTLNTQESAGGRGTVWQWFIVYNYLDNNGRDPDVWQGKKDDEGNSVHRHYFVWAWGKVGKHQLRCGEKNYDGKPLGYVKFDQQVDELETILERQMGEAKQKKLPDPRAEFEMIQKWWSINDELGKQTLAQLSFDDQQQHFKQQAELWNCGEKLAELLNKCEPRTIYPFRAVYLAKNSMEEKELRVFLAQPRGQRNRLMIVDWTNLLEPKLHGTYEGKIPRSVEGGDLIGAGFKNAVEEWEDENKYWPGGIRYEIDVTTGAGKIVSSGNIKTGNTSWTEDLAGVLKKIAAGAAILALVLTGVGSTLAGAMIVTSMVAGTTGSILSIHHRHSKGQGSFIDDAMDVLDIIGNCFGAGYRAGSKVLWRAGTTLQGVKVGEKVVKALFVGEVMTDGFNGMLLVGKTIDDYNKIMDAKGMLPDERAKKLLALFRDAATAGAMYGINNKVASVIEKADWHKLLDRTKPLDVSDAAKFKGKTSDGKKEVTVVNKQDRQPAANVKPNNPPATTVKPPAASMKPSDPIKPFPDTSASYDKTIWSKQPQVTDAEIDLRSTTGHKFYAHIDSDGRVSIDILTKINGQHNPHLGTGRENFDRMFHHFDANGHQIKGWGGIFAMDNFAEFKKARESLAVEKVKALKARGADNPQAVKDAIKEAQKEAVLETVTGKNFWKPWAEKKGLKIVVEDVTELSGMAAFEVKFKPK